MSIWVMKMKKFDNLLLREQVADLQRNPYLMATVETGKPEDHPETRRIAAKYLKDYTERCRCNAFIFDDTYEGMDIEEALKLIMAEEFSPAGKTPEGHIRFHHDYLAIGLTPRCDENGKLVAIAGNMALKVQEETINPVSICGLGLADAQIQAGHLYADIDFTGGMKVKMFVLRTLVSSEVNTKSLS